MTIIYQKWINLRPLIFIFISTVLIIILTGIIRIGLDLFGITEKEIGGLDSKKDGILYLSFIVLFVSPIIETIVTQQIPILLSQRIIKSNPNLIGIILSTIIFSVQHFGYSIWYVIEVIPAGLILANTFIIFQKRKESSFWMTSFVHSSRNLIALIFVIAEKYMI